MQFEMTNGVERAILTTPGNEVKPVRVQSSDVINRGGLDPDNLLGLSHARDVDRQLLTGWSESVGVSVVAPQHFDLQDLSDKVSVSASASVSVSGTQMKIGLSNAKGRRAGKDRPPPPKEGKDIGKDAAASELMQDAKMDAGGIDGRCRPPLPVGAGWANDASSIIHGSDTNHLHTLERSPRNRDVSAREQQEEHNLGVLRHAFHLPPPPPSRGGKFSYHHVIAPNLSEASPTSPELGRPWAGGASGGGERRQVVGLDLGLFQSQEVLEERKQQANALLHANRGCTPAAMATRKRSDVAGDAPALRSPRPNAISGAKAQAQRPTNEKNFYPYPHAQAAQGEGDGVAQVEPDPGTSSLTYIHMQSAPSPVAERGVGGGAGEGKHVLAANGGEEASEWKPSTFDLISAFHRRSRAQHEVWGS